MDFKIGDDIEEKTSKKKSMSNGLKITIVIIVSLIAGVSVFLISNYFFGEKTEKPITSEAVSLTDSNVQEAYSYITYGPLGMRYKKFVEEPSVTSSNFTDTEKFMYALSVSTKEDFIATGNKNEQGLNIYSLSNDKLKSYMSKFFKDDITYSLDKPIELTLDYQIDNNNTVTLTYDETSDSYLAVFTTNKEKTTPLIAPYISALAKATRKSDGSLQLQERVVYTDLVKNSEDNYTLNIYKDFSKSSLLETLPNMTSATLSNTQINITNYYDRASIITYELKKDSSGNYYFVSSTISS